MQLMRLREMESQQLHAYAPFDVEVPLRSGAAQVKIQGAG